MGNWELTPSHKSQQRVTNERADLQLKLLLGQGIEID